jgi:hypothetical protein
LNEAAVWHHAADHLRRRVPLHVVFAFIASFIASFAPSRLLLLLLREP